LPALVSATQEPRIAYIQITLGSKRQAHMVGRGLRKHWIGDHLLKVKTVEDAKPERFDNRTVLLRGIPTHWTQRQVIEAFATNDGALVSLELPMENRAMAEYVAERKYSGANSEATKTRDAAFKKAQLAVQQSLELDE